MSPTQRTLTWLKEREFMTGIVERWVSAPHLPGGGKRIDLFEIIDIIAIRNGLTYGVQSCGQNHAAHVNKIMGECKDKAVQWLAPHSNRLILISWRKVKKKRGGKAMIWKPRIVIFSRSWNMPPVGNLIQEKLPSIDLIMTDWNEDQEAGQIPNVVRLPM